MMAFRKNLLVTLGLGLFGVVGMVGGCSDDEEAQPAAQLDGGSFCPANLAAALDPATKCIGEGFLCAIGYSCGPYDQQATCRCEKGKFICSNGRGDSIDNAESPPCVSQGGGSEKECPGSQNGTDGASCKTPGLQCFYTGFTCPEDDGIPKVDNCQCVSRNAPDGGAMLQFRCEIKYCNPKSDASIPVPPPVDSGGG